MTARGHRPLRGHVLLPLGEGGPAKRKPDRAKLQDAKRKPNRAKLQDAKRKPNRAKLQDAKRKPDRAKPREKGRMRANKPHCLTSSAYLLTYGY